MAHLKHALALTICWRVGSVDATQHMYFNNLCTRFEELQQLFQEFNPAIIKDICGTTEFRTSGTWSELDGLSSEEALARRCATIGTEGLSRIKLFVPGLAFDGCKTHVLDACSAEERAELSVDGPFGLESAGIASRKNGTALVALGPNNARKDYVVKLVCYTLGVDVADACSFGDGDNDVEMMKTTGCSLTPSNAGSAAAKRVATKISALTNDEPNFVAAELEKWLAARSS